MPIMSVGVVMVFGVFYLSVVCPQHNSKMTDPKLFKLGMTLGYPRIDVVLRFKGQGHSYYKCIFTVIFGA